MGNGGVRILIHIGKLKIKIGPYSMTLSTSKPFLISVSTMSKHKV
jgi:hypothetical protein